MSPTSLAAEANYIEAIVLSDDGVKCSLIIVEPTVRRRVSSRGLLSPK